MKKLLYILCIGIISCGTAGKTEGNTTGKTVSDTTATVLTKETVYEKDSSLPACIKVLIDGFRKEEKQNPPRSVYSYTYKGALVYYVPAICCDFFSDLYDSKCNLVGHPDGGFTGRGDGKAADFITERSGEKLIWKDER